jgi:hypothetical protein
MGRVTSERARGQAAPTTVEHDDRSHSELGFVLRPPRKPEPKDPRAQSFLEWTDVIVYAMWRASSVVALIVALTLALLLYGPGLLR